MTRFCGEIGYGEAVETAPGVWEDQVVEHIYYGDVTRNARKLEEGQNLNDELSVSNSISIVADAYAREHFFTMKYANWAGTRWVITDVEVRPPRLILRLGGVYNGPTPKVPVPGSP